MSIKKILPIFLMTLVIYGIGAGYQPSQREPITAENADQITLLFGSQDIIASQPFDNAGDWLRLSTDNQILDTTTWQTVPLPISNRTAYVSPDGQFAAMFTDSDLRLWQVSSDPREIATLGLARPGSYSGPSVVFSPDSQLMLWQDQTAIRALETATGQLQASFGDLSLSGPLYFSPDNQWLVYENRPFLRLFNLKSGERLLIKEDAMFIGFTADNQWLVWKHGQELLGYHLSTRQEKLLYSAPSYRFLVEVRDNEALIFHDRMLITLNPTTGEQSYVEVGNSDSRFHDSELFLTNDLGVSIPSQGTTADFWQLSDNNLLASVTILPRLPNQPFGIIMSPQGNVVGLHDQGRVWLYDRRTGAETDISSAYLYLDPSRWRCRYDDLTFTFTPDETAFLVKDCENQVIRLWDTATGQQLAEWLGNSYVLAPDGATLVIRSTFGTLVYGIPSEGRLSRPAIPGEVEANSINLRATPSDSGEILDTIGGRLLAAGRSADGEYVFLADRQGWVRSASSYIKLMAPIEDLPVIEDVLPDWIDEPAPTRLDFAVSTPMSFITPTPEVTAAKITLEIVEESIPEPPGNLVAITPDNLDQVQLIGMLSRGYYLITPDEQAFVTARDNQIIKWDIVTLLPQTQADFSDERSTVQILSMTLLDAKGTALLVSLNRLPSNGGDGWPETWLWDMQSEPIQLAAVAALYAISPDERWFAFADESHNVHLWYLQSLEEKALLAGHSSEITSLQFSPDSKWLISGSVGNIDDNSLRLWQVETGSLKHLLECAAGDRDVLFSPDSSLLLAPHCQWSRLILWDVFTGAILLEYPEDIVDAAFGANGQVIVTLNRYSGPLHMITLDGTQIGDPIPVAGHFQIEGDFLLTAPERLSSSSRWQNWRVWNLNTGEHLVTYPGLLNLYTALDNRLFIGYSDSQVSVWDGHEPGTLLAGYDDFPASIVAVAYYRGRLLIRLEDGSLQAKDLADNLIPIVVTDEYNPQPSSFSYSWATAGLWLVDDEPEYHRLVPSFANPHLEFDRGSRAYLTADQATLLITNRYGNIMIFGIPSASRPAWQPVIGHVRSTGIHVRSEPDDDAETVQIISGDILIGGEANGYYYLPEIDGWVPGGDVYVELDKSLSPIPEFIWTENDDE